jgi:hypothetical protein
MLREVNEFDVIFLSYDEPNAEALYADLVNKVPWAKRVHGIKGFDTAHRACAHASETDFFVTVDGDNIIHEDFMSVKVDITPQQHDHAWTWASKNFVNGVIYGNGGLKLWSKSFVLGMNSHENSIGTGPKVDFCWDKRYHDLPGCYSTSFVNGSPYQAWRAGFREGVKMSLDQGHKVANKDFLDKIVNHNIHKLLIWCCVGSDIENGDWAMYGAISGVYNCNLSDWDFTNIIDYDWFAREWPNIKSLDLILQSAMRLELRRKLGLNLVSLDKDQSKFFKQLYQDPWRIK